MDIKKLIEIMEQRPSMYIGELKLESLYFFISGFLFNNIATHNADETDMMFKREFHEWVRKWIERNKNIVFDEDRNYLFYIQQVCQNQEQSVKLFFQLAREFFDGVHK